MRESPSSPETTRWPSRGGPYGLVLVLLFFALAGCVLAFFFYRRFYTDDALISLRYARNLLDGHGLVWNPGERVEGYTNFSLVILVSILGWLGMDLVQASRAVGIGSFVLLNLFVGTMGPRLLGRDSAHRRWIPLLLTMTSMPLILWSLGGLETVLFTLLITGAIWLSLPADRTRWQLWGSGLLLALAALTRPEGVLFFALVGLWHLSAVWRRRLAWPRLFLYGGPFVALYLPYFLWRWSYYGALLPNTFYVRVAPPAVVLQEGLVYLGMMIHFASLTLMLPVTLALLAVVIAKRRWEPRLTGLLFLLGAYFLYLVAVGGDHMLGLRFLVPALPSSALLLALLLERAGPLRWRGQALAEQAVLLLLLALQLAGPHPDIWKARWADPATFVGTVVGRYIDIHWPAGSLVALNTAGSTPYYAPHHRFLDMLGLNDAHIARRTAAEVPAHPDRAVVGHSKGDGAYVLSRRPDYIILGPAAGMPAAAAIHFPTDTDLRASPEFARDYRLRQVTIDVSDLPDHTRYAGLQDGTLTLIYYERVPVSP